MAIPSILFALAVLLPGVQDAGEDEDGGRGRPTVLASGFHLGSHASSVAARYDVDGGLDSGAAVLRLLDGATEEPIRFQDVMYGKGPTLALHGEARVGGLRLGLAVVAPGVSRGGDERALACLQVLATHPGDGEDQPRTLRLVGSIEPGPSDPLTRPMPSVRFDATDAFVREGEFVVRNGRAVATWLGEEPEVEVVRHVGGPDEECARFVWNLEVEPGASRIVEVLLAGPPAAGIVNESGFRDRMRRRSYAMLEEELRWQWMFYGEFSSLTCADPRFGKAMVAGIHFLRSLGAGQHGIEALSDQPYGHPPTDPAAEAQILGLLFEYGLDEIGMPYLDTLVAEMVSRMGWLPPDRQLAYLHGLSRAVRLALDDERVIPLAEAIVEYVREPVPVAPWLDPERVRLDLAAVLDDAGVPGGHELPELLWADVPESDEVASLMQSTRRALSDLRAEDAWSGMRSLLDLADPRGLGSMSPGGPLDAHYSMGLLTLARAFLFDDHGDSLHVFPALAYGFIRQKQDIETGWMPTRFGLYKAQVFHTGPRFVGGWIQRRPSRPPYRSVMSFPAGVQPIKLQGDPFGGAVELLPGGLAEFWVYQRVGTGLRFVTKIERDNT